MAELDAPHVAREQAFPALFPRAPIELRASLLQIPVFDDESLLITVQNLNPTTAVTVVCEGRAWSDRERRIKEFRFDAPCAALASATKIGPLERGAILTMRVSPLQTSGFPLGQVFVTVDMVKGVTGALAGTGLLISGYCTATSKLAWPGSPVHSSHEGLGWARGLQWTVLGLTVSLDVPGNRRWRFMGGVAQYACNGVAGNRTILLTVTRSGNAMWESECDPTIAAGVVRDFVVSPGMPSRGIVALRSQFMAYPLDLDLFQGDSVRMTSAGGDPGDTWTSVSAAVNEWFDPS